jgi:hypothetical protein
MGTGRVLDEAASLGLSAIEAGPRAFSRATPLMPCVCSGSTT